MSVVVDLRFLWHCEWEHGTLTDIMRHVDAYWTLHKTDLILWPHKFYALSCSYWLPMYTYVLFTHCVYTWFCFPRSELLYVAWVFHFWWPDTKHVILQHCQCLGWPRVLAANCLKFEPRLKWPGLKWPRLKWTIMLALGLCWRER